MITAAHAFYVLVLSLSSVHTIQPQSDITAPRIIEHPEDQYVAKNEPATLNCKAEGNPPPVISWYQDGQPVTTSHENPSSHRMLLPGGQLFFLRIIHNKSQRPDIGVYYCNATNPQTGVSVTSRNATLQIAVIKDEFKVEPQNTEVAIGDTAVLDCRGPNGKPEPRLSWKKDGQTIDPSENRRFTIQDTGSLMIQDARKEDTALYVCISSNIAGERESNPATLMVLEKPKFKKAPEAVTAKVGEVIQFPCQASGDPPPTILWSRGAGLMPQGRSEVLSNKSLKIENVRISDEGLYVCRAENSVGYVEASIKLTVHSPPSFVVTPRDKTVGVGRRVSFRCEVVGNPVPNVFWNKEGGTEMYYVNKDNGRFTVMTDGTLVIEPVQISDKGYFVCQGLSPAGNAFSKAYLEVKSVDPRPPPIIRQGPQNQTLPISSIAMLPCSSSGDPQPIISWIKNNRQLSTLNDPRITQLASGTLQISDLKPGDAGMYTCQATSETGETTWSAALAVEAPTNPSVIFHRTAEPSTFPGPPSKPQIVAVGENTITLSWKENPNHGSAAVFAYTVEYFSHQTGEGWIVASDSIRDQSYTVQNLEAMTSYMFLVRAQNTHGLSLPSRVTDPITTKGKGSHHGNDENEQIAREMLSGPTVELINPIVRSSTNIELSWRTRKSAKDYIEGFHIKFRIKPTTDQYGRQGNSQHTSFSIATVSGSEVNQYTFRNLNKYTWYEFRVQPFYHGVEGVESNMQSVRTLEDLPSAAPQNVRTKIFDNGTAQITWDPPPRHLHNGPIQGYKVFLHGNESRFDRTLHTNATAVYMTDMHKDVSYKVQVLAYNRIGDGVKTPMIAVGDVSVSLMEKKWFIGMIIACGLAFFLFILLCIFSIWIRHKKQRKKNNALAYHTKNGLITPGSVKADENSRQVQSYFSSLNAPNYLQKDIANHVQSVQQQQNFSSPQQPDVTHVGNGSAPQSEAEHYYNTPSSIQPMKTFYNKNQCAGPVSPYATTTLLQNNPALVSAPSSSVNSAFRPVQQNSGSNDSGCGGGGIPGKEIASSDSNNETRSNAELLPQCDQCGEHINSPLSDCESMMTEYDDPARYYMAGGVPGGPPMLFLPPPPEHPPPSDTEGGDYHSTRHVVKGNSPHYYYGHSGYMSGGRGSAPFSHYHSNTTGGSRDSPHNIHHQQPGGGIYSDGEQFRGNPYPCGHYSTGPYYPQHSRAVAQDGSPHNYTTAVPHKNSYNYNNSSNDNHSGNNNNGRAYSPRAMSEPERGPTPPVRAYKLVPINDSNSDPHRHYSDTEGAPVPPLRMVAPHTEEPPSPAPQEDYTQQLTAEMGGMDRGIQSSLPSLASECLASGRPGHESPSSEMGNFESDLEGGRRTPESSIGDPNDPENTATWGSDKNSEEESSAVSSSGDESFLAEADFASAVAKAAELSGLTVVGSVVSDPKNARDKVKKYKKPRDRPPRANSPYSTDSNYSSIAPPHKPYPKSERRKQMQSSSTNTSQQSTDDSTKVHSPPAATKPPPIKAKPQLPVIMNDLPSYNKPNFPSSGGASPRSPPNYCASTHVNLTTNPLAAFDTTNTPIV